MEKDVTRTLFFGAPLLFAFSIAQAQISSPPVTTSIFPQIVDGGAWLTAIALTNTSASPARASLSFFQDTGGGNTSPWSLNFLEMTSAQAQALVIPAGSTVFLHTLGAASSTTIGWGQWSQNGADGSPVVAYAIFTQIGASLQNGTAPAADLVSRILVPFDNTGTAVTTMAIANGTSLSEDISVGIRTAAGVLSPAPSWITLPAQGHTSFRFIDQFPGTAGQSGLAEFYSSTGFFSIIALRFQSGAFTTAPVYSAYGPPIIPSSGSGGTSNIVMAGFSVSKINYTTGSFPTTSTVADVLGGQFASYTPAEWQLPFAAQKFGPCSVLDVMYLGGKAPYSADSYLESGTINASGPNLTPGFTLSYDPFYTFAPPTGTTLALGGTYSISSNGGTQVGPFSSISATLPTSFAVTNWDAITSVNRANSLSIRWTGVGFDTVVVNIMATGGTSSTNHGVTVSCSLPASAGELVIPADALAALPVTTGQLTVSAETSSGGTTTAVSSTAHTLVPTLVGGGQVNYGSFTPSLVVTKNMPIQ